MFARYNSNQPHTAGRGQAIAVEILMQDGDVLKGQLYSSLASSLVELMNGDRAFLEFETYDGELFVIAKAAVRHVKPVNIPAARELEQSAKQMERFDPFAILGVTREASADTVREAYRDMVKLYHPDRYAGMELPREVLNYMASASQRINAAFKTVAAFVAERDRQASQPQAPASQNKPERPVFKMTAKRRPSPGRQQASGHRF